VTYTVWTNNIANINYISLDYTAWTNNIGLYCLIPAALTPAILRDKIIKQFKLFDYNNWYNLFDSISINHCKFIHIIELSLNPQVLYKSHSPINWGRRFNEVNTRIYHL